ncbi:thiamine phosphate synthase [Pontibacter sp. JAM-7]|uniref:thiamine phosphate synthase n=1 Tax=Pontibacter sp. JAM-7 TaxID=3366581 RepID=UPI003AF98519
MTALTGLYAITDAGLMPDTPTLLRQVEQSLLGGARLVQYRDKSNDTDNRLAQAKALRQLCQQYDVPLLINDDIELAYGCLANGVHLGQTDGTVVAARARLGPKAIIGVTCHADLTLAKQAVAAGADYVAFGACFPSRSKPDAQLAPLTLLQDASKQISCPIVAIGGISVDNARQVIDAGAGMVAVIHALFASDDISATAQQFSQLFPD